ncbi:hypothetical protein KIPB_016020, partial [Kipferlia bialata]
LFLTPSAKNAAGRHIESLPMRENVSWVGASDPDLRVFDIVMESNYGTSYNCYIIQCGDECVLIETVKNKDIHTEQLLARLYDAVGVNEDGSHKLRLSHIILNHTEPDHSSTAVQ